MYIDRVISMSTDGAVEPVVVQQHDRESRTVRFFVYERSGAALDVQGKTARVLFRKNGATSMPYDCQISADGWIVLTIPEAVTQNAGNGEMQLVIVDGTSLLHSFTLPFIVKSSLSFVGETESPADDPMAVNWQNLPGKPTAFPPSAHTHTPEEAGALPAQGTAVNAAMLGGKGPGYYLCPRNLLDNSFFETNQLGLSRYAGKIQYTVDRWKTTNVYTEVNVLSDGIQITNTEEGSGGYLQQNIEKPERLFGKRVTLAAMQTNGSLVVASAVLPTAFTASITQYATLTDNGTSIGAIQTSASAMWVRIWSNPAEDTRSFRWVALYEGEFTAEDLPAPVRPEDVVDLLKCQRHYLPLNTYVRYPLTRLSASEIDFLIPIPIKMRATPTLVGDIYVAAGLTDQTGFSFTVAGVGSNAISIRCTKSNHGLTAASNLSLRVSNAALDANM